MEGNESDIWYWSSKYNNIIKIKKQVDNPNMINYIKIIDIIIWLKSKGLLNFFKEQTIQNLEKWKGFFKFWSKKVF